MLDPIVVLSVPPIPPPPPLACYDSMLQGLSKEQTLVLSDTRELDRVPSTE